MPQALGDAESREVIALLQVVVGVVGRHPVCDRIDVQTNFLTRLGFADEHLTWRHQPSDQIQFRIVQVEGVAVNLAVHLRVGKEDFGGATLRNDREHARLLQLLERLRGQDHGGVQLPPGFLPLDHIVADGLVA